MEKIILVVEDDEMVRETIKYKLEKLGLTVVTAENGEQGFITWKKTAKKIALVVSDFNMPVLNGLDMIIKARQSNLQTPMIMFSGQSCHLGSGLTWIAKPDYPQLLETVTRLVNTT